MTNPIKKLKLSHSGGFRAGNPLLTKPRLGAPKPTNLYIIASSPRTGSTTVCDMLTSTGLVGSPTEIYPGSSWHTIKNVRPQISDEHALDDYLASSASNDLVAGAKFHWWRWSLFLEKFRGHALTMATKFIYLRRLDKLSQAVSWAKALQTNRWLPQQREVQQLEYDDALVEACLNAAYAEELAWHDWFTAHPALSVLYLQFETMFINPLDTVSKCLEFILDNTPKGYSTTYTFSPLRDSINEEWKVRYMRNHKTEPWWLS